jgi:hypothetical protein
MLVSLQAEQALQAAEGESAPAARLLLARNAAGCSLLKQLQVKFKRSLSIKQA